MEIYTIGGYNEVGKNMTVVDLGEDAFIFDCGLFLPPIVELEEKEKVYDEKKLVKKIEIDEELIKSLIESAKNKEKTAFSIKKEETSYSSIITLYYDALREILEAIAIKNGYKIYNHECYTCFLKEVLSKENFALKYDPLRKIRNGINYYGQKLSLKETEEIIKSILDLIKEVKSLI